MDQRDRGEGARRAVTGNDDGGLTPGELNRLALFVVVAVLAMFAMPFILTMLGA